MLIQRGSRENVDKIVIKFLESEFAKLNSKSKMTVENLHGGKPYLADPNHWNFVAAAKATEVRRQFDEFG
jgi:Cys-Gly metallodipeptidase DUG1